MRVAILNPTTSQLVEKMAALFPEGVELVGPRADVHHNHCEKRLAEWAEVGLKISIDQRPFGQIDFSAYDLLVESAETFLYSEAWKSNWQRVTCPTVLKVCFMDNTAYLPTGYVAARRKFPVLLEHASHAPAWRTSFEDVVMIPNPVGDWWFERPWTGAKEQALIVLAGRDVWRGDNPNSLGFDMWHEIERRFPGRTYHQDAAKNFRTTRQMIELFAESRVFVNLDGIGERPLALVFTEAVSAGLPVVARDLPGLSYRSYIGDNGICSDNLETICTFVKNCLADLEFARWCSQRSREIGLREFSLAGLGLRYAAIVERARRAFQEVAA